MPPHRRVNPHALLFVHVLLALCTPHTFFGYAFVPVVTQVLKVQSVPFPVVVVQGGAAVLHVAILGFFPGFVAFIVGLRLLFVATLVLDDVLPRKKGVCSGNVFRLGRGGTQGN